MLRVAPCLEGSLSLDLFQTELVFILCISFLGPANGWLKQQKSTVTVLEAEVQDQEGGGALLPLKFPEKCLLQVSLLSLMAP